MLLPTTGARATTRRSGLGTGAGRLLLAAPGGGLGPTRGGQGAGGVEPLGQPAAAPRGRVLVDRAFGGDLVEAPDGALEGLGGLIKVAAGEGGRECLDLGLDRVLAE